MSSTIAAVTTSGGGIVMSGDSSGNLSLLSGATTVVAVTSTGVAVTGTLAATGAVSGTTGTFTGAVVTPLSYVRLNTANGYGSTNTKIRRFTNIVNNVGADITYADSATLGATFTINTNGVYSVSYCEQYTASAQVGISINSTQLTTNVNNISTTDILSAATTSAANNGATAAATFYATATSVVRAHTQGTLGGADTATCQFTIARVQ
jgi:hypothetical protein